MKLQSNLVFLIFIIFITFPAFSKEREVLSILMDDFMEYVSDGSYTFLKDKNKISLVKRTNQLGVRSSSYLSPDGKTLMVSVDFYNGNERNFCGLNLNSNLKFTLPETGSSFQIKGFECGYFWGAIRVVKLANQPDNERTLIYTFSDDSGTVEYFAKSTLKTPKQRSIQNR